MFPAFLCKCLVLLSLLLLLLSVQLSLFLLYREPSAEVSSDPVERESKRIVWEDGRNDEQMQTDDWEGNWAEQGEHWPVDLSRSHPLQNSCKFPLLRPDEPDLLSHVRHFRAVRCPPSRAIPLVTQLRSGPILFGLPHRSNIPSGSQVACFARQLGGTLRPRVRQIQFLSNWTRIPQNRALEVPWEQFAVKCFLNASEGQRTMVFHDVFANVVPVPGRPLPANAPSKAPFGISILVVDSTARTQFLRHMPLTLRLLRQNRFRVMNGYTKVGDNSAINLLPVLAGALFEPERRGFERHWFRNVSVLGQAQIADAQRDFFGELLNASVVRLAEMGGYASLWNDDINTSGFGLFHYNSLKGFLRAPAQHYYRPFYEYIYQRLKASSGCVNGQFVAPRYIDIWERFAVKYGDRPQFAFTFLTGLTHASANAVELLDGPLSEALGRLKAAGHLERNVVIVMGDHGQRISSIQHSHSGRVEERMPLLAIGLPRQLETEWPDLAEALDENQNRLTSNFDVHQTLLHTLLLSAWRMRNASWANSVRQAMAQSEGTSLFERVPSRRSCRDARVPPQFCCCMEQRAGAEGTLPADLESRVHSLLLSEFRQSVAYLPCLLPQRLFHLAIDAQQQFRLFQLNVQARQGVRSPKALRQLIAQRGREALFSSQDDVLEVELNATLRTQAMLSGNSTRSGSGSTREVELHFLARVGYHRAKGQLLLREKPLLLGWLPPIGGACASGKEDEERLRGVPLILDTFCECLLDRLG